MSGPSSHQANTAGIPVLAPTGQFADKPAFFLRQQCVIVGGQAGCELQLMAPDINAVHALIVTSRHGVYIRNLSGRPNVLVNGLSYLEYHLNDADDVQIGAFTFKFFVNHSHFEPLIQRAAAVIELAGAGARPIAGSVVQVGKLISSEVCLNDPGVSDVRAVIFATGSAWHVLDLDAAGGMQIGGKATRFADLHSGEIIAIGQYQMRMVIAPSGAEAERQGGAIIQSQRPVVGGVGELFGATDGGVMLGGLPVELPNVAPPQGFGRVAVSFAGKNLAAKIDGPIEDEVSPHFGQAAPATNAEALPGKSAGLRGSTTPDAVKPPVYNEAVTTPRTSVLRNFPPLPRVKLKGSQQEKPGNEDEAGKSDAAEESTGVDETVESIAEVSPQLIGREESVSPPLGGEPWADEAGFVMAYNAWGNAPREGTISGSDLDVFGGGGQDDGQSFVAPASQESSEPYLSEVEDFSENSFWDSTDDEQKDVPLPERGRDFSPAIPGSNDDATSANIHAMGGIVAQPIGAGDQTVAGATDAFSGLPAAEAGGGIAGGADGATAGAAAGTAESDTDKIALALPSERPHIHGEVEAKSSASAGNMPRSRDTDIRNYLSADLAGEYPGPGGMQRKMTVLLGAMVASMAIAVGGIYFLIPNASVVEGRITFVNTPAEGTPQWTAFVADQRQRLADASLQSAAAAVLKSDYLDNAPGILAGDLAPFEKLMNGATFQKSVAPDSAGIAGGNAQEAHDMVLRLSGTDSSADSRRLGAVLKAISEHEKDLVAAAAAARKALADWDPAIASKQQELASEADQIAEQKKIADTAGDLAEKVPALSTGAAAAYNAFITTDKAVEADENNLALINARLLARPGKNIAAATPSTSPSDTDEMSSSDPELADLQRRMQELADKIAGLSATGGGGNEAAIAKIVSDSQKQLDAEKTAAQEMLTGNPDVAQVVKSAIELQNRVTAQIALLLKLRGGSREQFDQLMLDAARYTRLRQQRIYDADDQLAELKNQYDEGRLALAAAHDPTAVAEAQRRVDLLLGQIESRRRALNDDDSLALRERLGRVVSGETARLNGDRQFIEQTLQTLVAQLSAIPDEPSLSDMEKRQFVRVLQRVINLAQAQNVYAVEITRPQDAGTEIAMAKQEMDDLKSLIQRRRDELGATMPADDYRPVLIAARDKLAVQVKGDLKAMSSAGSEFVAAATADINAALQLQAARSAQEKLVALTQSRDAKLSDLDAMRQNRADLVNRVQASVDVKKPSESDVIVVSDSTSRKMEYMLGASLAIGLAFAAIGFVIAGLGEKHGTPLAGAAG